MNLSDSQQATLKALIERLIPADDFPSGWDDGVDAYLARHWDGDLAPYHSLISAGLDALQDEAQQRYDYLSFADLSPVQQDDLLKSLEKNAVQTAWPILPKEFLQTMTNLAAEGYYSDPGNRGGRQNSAWKMIGFREGAVSPLEQALNSFAVQPSAVTEVKPAYDAIVIGAGAAGGIVACLLAEAGKQVLLLERGRWQTYQAVGRDHLRNHRLALYGHNTGPDLDGNPRVFVDGAGQDHVLLPHQSGYHNNAMGVGGGTRIYGGQAWRFLPTDFRMASTYGVPEGSSLVDWPIAYEDLAPYYERAEWEIGVAGASGSDGHAGRGPRQRGYPMPSVPPDPKRQVLAAGAAKLGWNTAPPPLLINTVPYLGRPACVQCGTCVGFACPSESKNGTHNTMIPRALATGKCTLLCEAQVDQITTDDQGRVTGVTLFQESDGQVHRLSVEAETVVLSAGAIESARLLLNSRLAAHPDGLGNAHDQVGRHLQGHVYTGALGLFTEVVEDGKGPGVTISTCDFNHGNPGIIGGGMLANEFTKLPIIFWRSALPPDLPRWGQANKDYMRTNYRRTIHVMGPIQDIPNPEARVTLDPKVTDRFGMPVARLSGTTHPESIRTAEFMRARAEEWLRASGAEQIWSYPNHLSLSGGQHQAGTCRMGTNPENSVTDLWGRVHGHDNLYVVNGAQHVTNGGLNPVLTIMALAFRSGEHITGNNDVA